MQDKPGHQNRDRTSLRRMTRVLRALTEGSLVVIGFGFAVLLLGLPIVLSVRAASAVLSWTIGAARELAILDEALYLGSVIGALVLMALAVRALVAFFGWRRTIRGRVAHSRSRGGPCETAHTAAEAA